LEKRIPGRNRNVSKERKEEESWTKVLGRKKRQEKREEPRQRKEVEKRQVEVTRQRSKSRNRPLKALEKKLPKGTGIIMEIQGGGSKEYEKVVKDCEEAISLEEVGISPINMRRTRGGGILLEIKGDREEEKAELLASRIKEVIKKNEGPRHYYHYDPYESLEILITQFPQRTDPLPSRSYTNGPDDFDLIEIRQIIETQDLDFIIPVFLPNCLVPDRFFYNLFPPSTVRINELNHSAPLPPHTFSE